MFRHCLENAIPDYHPQCFNRTLDRFFYSRSLGFRKHVEHESLRIGQRMFRLNSNPETNKFICTYRCDNRLKPVMASCRSAFANPDLSQWQGQIVRYHYQLVTRFIALVFRQQTRDRLSTQVHKRLRLDQLHCAAFKFAATYQRTAFATAYGDPGITCQPVNQHETQVVSRPFVLFARITEPDNKTHGDCRFAIADCPICFSLSSTG